MKFLTCVPAILLHAFLKAGILIKPVDEFPTLLLYPDDSRENVILQQSQSVLPHFSCQTITPSKLAQPPTTIDS